MDSKEFRKQAHQIVDWMADYFENINQYPVKSTVKPQEILNQLPLHAPQEGEPMDQIFKDFLNIILPGMTHWQHPNFLAYFPANTSYASILGEMITATLGAQCMIWDTSPAAAELEERVTDWLKESMNLPDYFSGVIQDTASTATLTALITARETFSKFKINQEGLRNNLLRVYCSEEAHSSVEKAVKIMGLGRQSLVKIKTDKHLAMSVTALQQAIEDDLKQGLKPFCVVAAIGTTGTTAVDPLKAIAALCKKHQIWLHVDAAYAGSLLLLPEYQWMIEGIEDVDSFVFNAHKWLFTNFDCSIYFVKDQKSLIQTFEILPEYLKTTSRGQVNDYRDWGVPLGRRFRALKLWFVLRNFGIKGIQQKLREHNRLALLFAEWIKADPDFELLAPVNMNLVCFRYLDPSVDADALNDANSQLIHRLNESGDIYLTHTKIGNNIALRACFGQTHVAEHHVEFCWKCIQKQAKKQPNKAN